MATSRSTESHLQGNELSSDILHWNSYIGIEVQIVDLAVIIFFMKSSYKMNVYDAFWISETLIVYHKY